jgi:hypothetical protein
MADPTTPARASEAPKRVFEALLLTAALLSFAQLIGLFGRRAALDGVALAILFTFVLPWLPPLLGLAVTRRRSVVAKWVLLTLTALTLFTAWRIGTARWSDPIILLGAVAGALEAAAAMLLLTLGRSWTRGRPDPQL